VERAGAEAIYEQGRVVVVAVLVGMDEQIERLSERVARQDERIAELERRLNRNSRSSSTPPSRDPPGTPERKLADPSGRKQGAQPGHPGRGRGLLSVGAVDLVVEHGPSVAAAGMCSVRRSVLGSGSLRATRCRSCPRSPWR
jgi:Family of unknown function (DUF6444)